MITATAPWFFVLLLPAIGLLYWAYRMQGNPQRIIFSSLYLLEKLRRAPQAKRKLILPLRFFVELCIFIALLAALAGLSLPIKSPIAVIILDNSESMGQLGDSETTLFQKGREYIENWTNNFASSNAWSSPKFWAILTSPRPHLLSDIAISRGELIQALLGLQPTASAGDLHQAFALANSIDDMESLLLVSDQAPSKESLVPEEPEKRKVFINTYLPQSSTPVFAPENYHNIAIESAEFLSSENTLNIFLRSHSFATQSVEIELFSLQLGQASLQPKVLRRGKATLQPDSRKIFSFQNITPPELALIVITSKSDALPADNFFYLAPRITTKTVKVSSPLPLNRMKLPSYSELSYSKMDEGDQSSRFIISHLENRESVLALSGLHVLPRTPSMLQEKTNGPTRAGNIIHGNTSHSLLDYIDLYATQFREVTPLKLPSWAEPLIEVEAGVIAYFGFQDGRPQIVAGFELFPLPGTESPMQPIFFLNCLKWLSTNSGASDDSSSEYSNNQKPLFFHSATISTPIEILHSNEIDQRGIFFQDDRIQGVRNFYLPQESEFPSHTISLMKDFHSKTDSTSKQAGLPRYWIWILTLLLFFDVLLLFVSSRYMSRS